MTPFPFWTLQYLLCQSPTPLSGYLLVLVSQGTHHFYLLVSFSLGQNFVQSSNSYKQNLYSLEDEIVSKVRQTLSYTTFWLDAASSMCEEVEGS